MMGPRCITALWVTLTIVFTLAICLSILSPVWFENTSEAPNKLPGKTRQSISNNVVVTANDYDPVTLGLIRYCHRYELDEVLLDCGFFKSMQDLPSIAWMISAIIYAIGAVFFFISVVLALLAVCSGEEIGDKLKIAAAYIQVIGVGFLAIGVLMFPLGLDSGFSRDVCGLDAKMFVADKCQVAWGYVLGIMAVSLTIFCPILAKYSTELKDNGGLSRSGGSGTYSDYEYNKSDVISLTTSNTSKVMTTV